MSLRAAVAVAGELLSDPGANEFFARKAFGLSHLLDGLDFARLQKQLHWSGSHENGVVDFLQFIVKIRQVVAVTKTEPAS